MLLVRYICLAVCQLMAGDTGRPEKRNWADSAPFRHPATVDRPYVNRHSWGLMLMIQCLPQQPDFQFCSGSFSLMYGELSPGAQAWFYSFKYWTGFEFRRR